MKHHKYHRVTQKDLDLVHILADNKMSASGIASVTGMNLSTIGRLKSSKTLEDYFEIRDGYALNRKMKQENNQEQVAETTAPKLNYNIDGVFQGQVISSIALSLEKINDNLQRLAEAWEKKPASEYLKEL